MTTTLRRLADFVRYVLRRVLVDPVHSGMLRSARWPRGLGAVVTAGYLLYALATVTVLLAPWLRTWQPLRVALTNTMPAPIMILVQVVLAFTLTLVFCAGLRLRRWLRPLIWLVVTSVLLIPLNLKQVAEYPRLHGPALWVTLAAPLALGLLMLLRWRTGFTWWEFPLALSIIGTALYAGATAYGALFDSPTHSRTLGNLVLMAALLSLLATPVMLTAGAALGELAVSTAAWTGTGLRRLLTPTEGRGGRPGPIGVRIELAAVLLALVGARAVQLQEDLSNGGFASRLTGLAGGTGVVVLIAGAMALAIWWADRVSGDFDLRPDPDDLPQAWRSELPWLALILGVPMVADQVIGKICATFGFPAVTAFFDSLPHAQLRPAVTVLAAVALAVHTVRRGMRVAAAVTAAFAATMLASWINTLLNITADADAATVLAGPVALVTALVLLTTGRLTTAKLVTLVTVLLLAVLWPYRDWIAEPVAVLATGSGISLTLVLGLIWRLLTDGEYARHGTPGFPIPARVLLVLGNAFLGLLLVLMLAGFGGNFPHRPDSVERIGEQDLAHTLMIMAICLGCAAALPGGRQISAGNTRLR